MGGEQGEVERLRAANAVLRAVNERQAGELAAVRADNAKLVVRVDELAALVAELQRRLGQDSGNSSRPPSSAGLTKKPVQPRGRGGRRGKQPGAHLAQVADPDAVVDHVPAAMSVSSRTCCHIETKVCRTATARDTELSPPGDEGVEGEAEGTAAACAARSSSSWTDTPIQFSASRVS